MTDAITENEVTPVPFVTTDNPEFDRLRRQLLEAYHKAGVQSNINLNDVRQGRPLQDIEEDDLRVLGGLVVRYQEAAETRAGIAADHCPEPGDSITDEGGTVIGGAEPVTTNPGGEG